jgi:uncharacterized protein YjbI with pentapeptide repeats
LTKAFLVGADLNGAWLYGTVLSNADLSMADLRDVNFQQARLNGANFTDADIRGAEFVETVFRGFTPGQLYSTASYKSGDLTGIDFRSNNLGGWNFAGKNLTNAGFQDARLTNADFTGAVVKGAVFIDSGLTASQLYATASYQSGDLTGIKLALNDLSGWDFAGKNLTNANLGESNLTNTDFTGANVRSISLSDTVSHGFTAEQLYSTASYQARDLTGIFLGWPLPHLSNDLSGWNFAGQNLTNAYFSTTTLTNTDFTNAEVRGAAFFDTTTRGFTAAQLYSTASYKAGDLTGIRFGYQFSYNSDTDLSGWSFSGINLTGADFANVRLSNADFTGASVYRANFASTTSRGFTADQFYSTSTYQSGDLSGIIFGAFWVDGEGNNLSGWTFADKNLTGARFYKTILNNADFRGAILHRTDFYLATLTGANFGAADVRGASPNLDGSITTNMIWPDGNIHGLDLAGTRSLIVRNYDGDRFANMIPIVVEQRLNMDATSTLRMLFEASAWGSTISFTPNIPVVFGGTLELDFAAGVNVDSQNGRTIRIFDWTGVTPIGTFNNLVSPYEWDLSKLYTTGEVTLLPVPGLLGDFNNDGLVDAADYVAWRERGGSQDDYNVWRSNFGSRSFTIRIPGDYDGNGAVDATDYAVWRNGFGQIGPGLAADGNRDGTVDLLDYHLWQAHFGQAAAGSSTSSIESFAGVPEPHTSLLVGLALMQLFYERNHLRIHSRRRFLNRRQQRELSPNRGLRRQSTVTASLLSLCSPVQKSVNSMVFRNPLAVVLLLTLLAADLAPQASAEPPMMLRWEIEATIISKDDPNGIFPDVRLGDPVRGTLMYDAARESDCYSLACWLGGRDQYVHPRWLEVVSMLIDNPRTGGEYRFTMDLTGNWADLLVGVELVDVDVEEYFVVAAQSVISPSPLFTGETPVVLIGLGKVPPEMLDFSPPTELNLDDWPYAKLVFADLNLEDVGGTRLEAEIFSLTSIPVPSLAGDYNYDGAVDGKDYYGWKSSYESWTELYADGNGDGIVDAADYVVWRDNVVTGGSVAAVTEPPVTTVAAPEPGTLPLAMLAVVAFMRRVPRSESTITVWENAEGARLNSPGSRSAPWGTNHSCRCYAEGVTRP